MVQEPDPRFLPSSQSKLHPLLPVLSPWHPGTFKKRSKSLCQIFKHKTTYQSFVAVGLPFLSNSNDLQLFTIFVLDPLDSLKLWVHHERPTLARSENGGILSGHFVSRQSFILPCRNVCIIYQHGERVQVRGHWDGNL